MKAYELLYFVDPAAPDNIRDNVSSRIEGVVSVDGGVIDSVEDWGKRKLAYEIDHLKDGYYILVNFHADPMHIAELNRVLRINDNVKRHMIVRRPDKD